MLPLGFIFKKHGISNHCFADIVQIYVPLISEGNPIIKLLNCLKVLKSWMALNFLNLLKKTEMFRFGHSELLNDAVSVLGPFTSYSRTHAKNLE